MFQSRLAGVSELIPAAFRVLAVRGKIARFAARRARNPRPERLRAASAPPQTEAAPQGRAGERGRDPPPRPLLRVEGFGALRLRNLGGENRLPPFPPHPLPLARVVRGAEARRGGRPLLNCRGVKFESHQQYSS